MTTPKFSPHVTRQLYILSLCRFAEPIALTSIFPYLYYMIKSFGVNPSDISFYAGITAASFSFAQFFTGIFWGRISDKVGRKPLVLIGLCGTMLSLLAFGFSTSLWMAILARTVSGLVNGNVGILRTVVAELVPERELQPRAFSIMPLVWNVASVLGPIIGGSLADPLTNHPEWFGEKRPPFFVRFPFALPCIVSSVFFLIGIPIGFLFLDETLEQKKNEPDIGRKLGKRLISCARCVKGRRYYKSIDDETSSLSSVSSERYDRSASKVKGSQWQDAPPLRAAFTFQSTINIIFYMLLAFHSITFDQLIPVFLSYPSQSPNEFQLPFKFAGGFGLSSSEVGSIFSLYGFAGMTIQFLFFPPIAQKFGSLLCLRIVAYTAPVAYLLTPFLILLPEKLQHPGLYAIMVIKCISVVFAFPCSTILLTNSSPSPRVLGTLNGIAVAVAAMGRALGPMLGGILFSYGQKTGYLILPWFTLAAVGLFGALPTLFMVDKCDLSDQENEYLTEDEPRSYGTAEPTSSVATNGNSTP